mmetsp:Transcript_39816/g.102569  ORF Transcript_39816/g.102569 Transcript_39816/m.102569 type:complete len:90 (-) Transcript_39816:864-1133(-)
MKSGKERKRNGLRRMQSALLHQYTFNMQSSVLPAFFKWSRVDAPRPCTSFYPAFFTLFLMGYRNQTAFVSTKAQRSVLGVVWLVRFDSA